MKPLFLTVLLCISFTSLYAMDPPSSQSAEGNNNKTIVQLLKQFVLNGRITISQSGVGHSALYTITFPPPPVTITPATPIIVPTHNRLQNRFPIVIGSIGAAAIIGGILYSYHKQEQEDGSTSFFSHIFLGIQALLNANTFDWNILEKFQHDEGAIISIGSGAIASVGLLASLLRHPPPLPAVPMTPPVHIRTPYADLELEALYQWDQRSGADNRANTIEETYDSDLERAIFVENLNLATALLENKVYAVPILRSAMKLAEALGYTGLAKRLKAKHGQTVRISYRVKKKNKKKNSS